MEADTANTDATKPIVELHLAESSVKEQDIGAASPPLITDDLPPDQSQQQQEEPRHQKDQSEGAEIPIETKPVDPVPVQQDGNAIPTPPQTAVPIVSTSIAPKLFRIAVNDELERLRITNTLSTFLEEVVEGNSLKSKNLLKLSHIYSQAGKAGVLPSLSSIVEELLKASILTVGKHTGSFAANVKQGVCVLLPEHVKNSRKRIQSTYNRIVTIQEEIKKTKLSYARLVERQQRTIKEAEQTLLAANSEEEVPTPKDEGTFIKMMSKIAGEKKGLERYREILKELDSIEYQMQSDFRRINVSRSELAIEISKAFKELEEQEMERLQVMREGIDRFLLSLDLTMKSQLEAFSPAEAQLAKLDLRAEIDSFLGRTISMDGGSFPSIFQAFDLESEKSKYSLVLHQVSVKADRMAEILDFFQGLTQRLVQCVADAENAESIDYKASIRAIEKNGFPRLPADEDVFANYKPNSGAAQFLYQELPMTRQQWGALVNIVGHLVEAYSRTIEFYSEETSQQFDLIQKRIVMCKKDLTEKHSSAMKKIEATLQDVGRIRVKLTKIRQQIKEKKQFVRNLKGGNNDAVADEEDGDVPDDDSSVGQDAAVSPGPATPTSSSSSTAASTFAAGFGRARATLKAFESFNSTLRGAANLKQVVGLETTADRINRVESQISQLEEEERLNMEFEKNAIRIYEDCLNNCHRDLEDSVSLTVEIFLADVDTLKRALSKYLNWQKEKFSPIIMHSKQLKESINSPSNNIRDDYRVVYNRLVGRDNFFEGELFDIPPAEVFEGHKLERYDDEDNNGDGNNAGPSENRGIDGESGEDNTERSKRTTSEDFSNSLESPSKGLPSAEFELKKFGLSSQDKVLESYSCALYPKKGILTHGRMFVTQHFIAFSGWPDTRVLLQMGSVEKIDKMNTLMYIPNAISIVTNDQEEYFFGSFIDRDQCYYLIKNLLEVEKRIVELNGVNEAVASRKLEYGYQANKVPSISTKILGSAFVATPSKDQTNSEVAAPVPVKDTAPAATASSGPAEDKEEEEVDIFKELSINFGNTFSTGSLIELATMKFDSSAKKIFQTCWQNVVDYETYLTNSGDFDIKKEEWRALPPPVEDVCKLNFSFARELNYQHPRTTMLMFGPKNAPTKQTHYLYVPFESNNGNSDFTIENIAKSKITKFAILFITQFDGVPMADVFKVLQYQFYENIGDSNKCSVRIGLQMHYIKSSMFKSQIMSGTKEELGSQIASWLDYVKKKSSAGGSVRAIATGDAGSGGGEGAVAGNASTTGAGSVTAGAVYTGGSASQQDITQQILAAMMNNIPALVLLVLVLLFFFMHIWYTRSKIVYLTSKVRSLENFQKKVLVDLINKVAANSACKNA